MKTLKRAAMAIIAAAGLVTSASGEPAMWTLSDDDTTINIIGTVHLLPPETDWRSDRIEAAFEAADTVCFELDAVGRALQVAGESFSRGVLQGGDRLTNHLSADEVEGLKAVAAELGIPFPSLNVMQPWFVGLTIEQYLADRAGLAEGVEFTLHPEVLESGKTLCELETVEEQMTALAGLPFEVQLDLLKQGQEEVETLGAAGAIEEAMDDLDDLIAFWLAGDIDQLATMVTPEEMGHQAFYDALLVTRNEAWVPRIEAMLEDEGIVLIAVGAAHLAGEDSVITMLRNKGYEIEGP